jgi:stage II sporulation protein D
MRGKLVLFLALLAAAALTLGWNVGRNPRFLIGPSADDGLSAVPHQADLPCPVVVRVNLTDSPVSRVRIDIDGPYAIRPFNGWGLILQGNRLGPVTFQHLSDGFRIGKVRLPGFGSLEIVSERSPAIRVDNHLYRGRVRFFSRPDGKMIVVNVVPIEDYIASVVDGEMPARFPEAARQAQAIVARSYALFQIDAAKDNPFFDVYASTRSQAYLGCRYWDSAGRAFAGESESSRLVAAQTAGMVCLYDGKVFCTYYTAVCGGRTADGMQVFDDPCPALCSVDCTWCRDAERYRWTRVLPARQASKLFKRFFASQGRRFGELASIRSDQDAASVRAARFEIGDGKHRYRLSVLDMRRILGTSAIPSLQFTPRLSGSELILEGHGHGHCVGLCQWGARGMALAGHGPLQILAHYYPGARVVSLK